MSLRLLILERGEVVLELLKKAAKYPHFFPNPKNPNLQNALIDTS